MDARLLDVLHHGRDVRLLAVAERVDVELDRVLEEAVDEHRPVDGGHRLAHVGRVVADAHRAAAEDVRGAHEHGVADPRGDGDRLVRRLGDPPLGAADRRACRGAARSARDPRRGRPRRTASRGSDARRLDRAREPERRLAAELDAHADRPLALEHGEHRFLVERLEVEPVGGVVVGRDRLGVAVDHHGLVALRAEAARGVDAAVVELDPLADPVRAAAEDHDRPPRLRRRLVAFAARRVEVVRARLDLALRTSRLAGRRPRPRAPAPRARARTTGGGSRAAIPGRPRARAAPSRTPRRRCARCPSPRRPTSSASRASRRRPRTSRTRSAGTSRRRSRASARSSPASCPSGRSGSRRACSRPRASPPPSRSGSRSPSTRAPTSARRAGSSRSRAARRSRGRARTGRSSRRCRRRPRG